MDKILRRVRMAERQVARRAKRREEQQAASERANTRQQVINYRRQAGSRLATAIKHRHEDWELGPLAPRRDVSRADKYGTYWGSVHAESANLSVTLTEEQRQARAAWAGGAEHLCLAPKDRVVIQDGPYKGRISKILRINEDTMTVELEGVMANQTIPDYMRPEGMDPVEPYQVPIPISSVRLVHPIQDPTTGTFRDVIIRELKPASIRRDRPTRDVSFKRVVPGENIEIPWPSKPEPDYVAHPVDTLRIDVDERTFVPTLLRPPMPEVVLDELRNRYSKFRTRHTEEYIAQKEAEEAEKKARSQSARSMLLPVQELNRKLRAERRALGQPVLTEEMLARIGEVMARNAEARAKGKTVAQLEEMQRLPRGVDEVQSAVEQLSLREDESSTPEDQPRS
ncbi:hypothetical protein QBC47DRAFT_128565 [Echria macrotheca]|uniref:KOW domain-containing protein n=1 Tax=Echria macrotheca TaxID=438768 RepID=A0AAJ0B1M2_9PEZI|nr:hypothetical protein QBC47DRAFT_128565 [Echria macrotheca]